MNKTIDFHNPSEKEGTDPSQSIAAAQAKAIAEHSVDFTECEVAVCVHTYRKYNSGYGDWVWMDPSAYADQCEFLEACRQVHCDEAEPELMIADDNEIPPQFISDSWLDERFWDFWKEWAGLDDDQRKAVLLYWQSTLDNETALTESWQWNPAEVLEAYVGSFDNMSDLGNALFEMSGWWSQIPENLHPYFDTASFAEDCRLGGDIFIEVDELRLFVYWAR